MQMLRPVSPVTMPSLAQVLGTPLADSTVGDGNFAAFMGVETSAGPKRPSLEILKAQGFGPGNVIAKTASADAEGLLTSSVQSADRATSALDRTGEDQVGAAGQPLPLSSAGTVKPDTQTFAIEPQVLPSADVLPVGPIQAETALPPSLKERDPFTVLHRPTSEGEAGSPGDATWGGNETRPLETQSKSDIILDGNTGVSKTVIGETVQIPEPHLAVVAQSGVDTLLLKAVEQTIAHSIDLSTSENRSAPMAVSASEDAAVQADAPAGRESPQALAAQWPLNGRYLANPDDATVSGISLLPGPANEEPASVLGQGPTSKLSAEVAIKLPNTADVSPLPPPTAEPSPQVGSSWPDFEHQPNQHLHRSAQVSPWPNASLTTALDPDVNGAATANSVAQPPSRGAASDTQADLAPIRTRMAPESAVGMAKAPPKADDQIPAFFADRVQWYTQDLTGRPDAFAASNGLAPQQTAPIEAVQTSPSERIKLPANAPDSVPEEGQTFFAPPKADDGLHRPNSQRISPSGTASASVLTTEITPGSSPTPVDLETPDPSLRVQGDQVLVRTLPKSLPPLETAVARTATDSVALLTSLKDSLPEPLRERSFVTAFKLHAADDPAAKRAAAPSFDVRPVAGAPSTSPTAPSNPFAPQDTSFGLPNGVDGTAGAHSAAETGPLTPPHPVKGQTNPQLLTNFGPAVPMMVPIEEGSMSGSSPEPAQGERESAVTTGSGIAASHPVLHHSATSQITPRHLLPQVSQGLQAFVRQETADQVNLTLSPEELGQVQFEMTTKGDRLHISLFVERGETMDLLRRNVDQLLGELRQSGLGQPSLSFGNWSQREQAKAEPAASLEGSDPSEEPGGPLPPHTRRIAANGRLDLRL